jgi:hypothetical protein
MPEEAWIWTSSKFRPRAIRITGFGMGNAWKKVVSRPNSTGLPPRKKRTRKLKIILGMVLYGN